MAQADTEVTILVREGNGWRQYMVVSDARVAVVHMVPALLCGWNFTRVDIQGSDDWRTMSRDEIVDWKFRFNDGRTEIAPNLGSFRATLIARAYGGL